VILWQAKGVLDSILQEKTFTLKNAARMGRAAACCFVISGAALGRTVWGLCAYRSAAPLLTYNFLFVPLFLLAGLVCMVMSALFRQAAEMKAENDLTI
jgi:threonine/homoserine/homoserine lactone efflux protein